MYVCVCVFHLIEIELIDNIMLVSSISHSDSTVKYIFRNRHFLEKLSQRRVNSPQVNHLVCFVFRNLVRQNLDLGEGFLWCAWLLCSLSSSVTTDQTLHYKNIAHNKV